MFLINGWDYPKLYLPLFNIFAKKEEVRALYKGLVQIISVDPFSSLYMFPAVVNKVIYEVEKRFQDILKVEIFTGIENREIRIVVHSFQIYEVSRYKEEEDYIVITDKEKKELSKNFDLEEYHQAIQDLEPLEFFSNSQVSLA